MTSCNRPRLSSSRVFGQAQQSIHYLAAVAQVLDRFEQRDDIEIERPLAWPQ